MLKLFLLLMFFLLMAQPIFLCVNFIFYQAFRYVAVAVFHLMLLVLSLVESLIVWSSFSLLKNFQFQSLHSGFPIDSGFLNLLVFFINEKSFSNNVANIKRTNVFLISELFILILSVFSKNNLSALSNVKKIWCWFYLFTTNNQRSWWVESNSCHYYSLKRVY